MGTLHSHDKIYSTHSILPELYEIWANINSLEFNPFTLSERS